jgi:hypothetical protein
VGDEVGRGDLDRDFAVGVAETPVAGKVRDLAREAHPRPSTFRLEASEEAEAEGNGDREGTR